MSSNAYGVLIAVLGFVGGGGGALWLSRRRESGQVDTTDAGQLWAQSTQFQATVRDYMEQLQRDLTSARSETAQVRDAAARDRADSSREVQQLREEVGRLSQELNAFRLGIAAPLGYVIIPRVLWEQVRERDLARNELPAVQFPGEDVNRVVRDIKDPGEGGGV